MTLAGKASTEQGAQRNLRLNTYSLVLANLLTAVLGLVFWGVAARLYPAEAVGIGAAVLVALALPMLDIRLGFGDYGNQSESQTVRRAYDLMADGFGAGANATFLLVADRGDATALADLSDSQIGVQIGTTSLDAVNATIKPSKQPKVFNDSNDVVSALKQNQVDAIVVDLPTAFFLTAAQVPSAKIIGQFAAPGGDSWGALLEKDSSLTSCVSEAVTKLKDSGKLKEIEDRWMGSAAGAPELQ